ncbi:acylphosphatase [Gemmatimonadota bacterium]
MSDAGNENVRRYAHVTGRVQGVGFRWYCQRAACARGLTGWVRNMSDGNVELEVEGPESIVEAFLRDVEQGPSGSRVTGSSINDMPVAGDDSFLIRFDA